MTAGRAFAGGAISVVNAIITGQLGASVGVALRTEAKVTLLEDVPEVEVIINGDGFGSSRSEAVPAPEHGWKAEDATLARLVLKGVVSRLGEPDWGGRVETTSDIPASRGLKSSSAAANAIALATNQAFLHYEGKALSRNELLGVAIEAALDAGVTITGAFDDASASLSGGLCVTDNPARKLLHREDADESLRVVILVPSTKTPTKSVKDLPYAPFAPLAREAHSMAHRGRWMDALTLNGLVAGALYGTPPAWTRDALAAGALCAGVSGTGPAFAAVCRADDEKAVEAALQAHAPAGAKLLNTRLSNARASEVLS